MTKEIPLTQGKVALVDDEDYERLSRFKWYANKNRRIWYACTNQNQLILMHRLILDAKPNEACDHINRDGLDNRRSNLRIATNQQNHWNQAKCRHRNGLPVSSVYKGVSFKRHRGRWEAAIVVQGRQVYLGRFLNELDAALAYDRAALHFFGCFARPNFPT